MPIIVDSSVAASWSIPDEDSEIARRALHLAFRTGMLVPQIFWYEFRNVLVINERRGRLLVDETEAGLRNVLDLSPTTDPEAPNDSVMLLARKHRLTIYDAAYLELALRYRAVLATLDTRLAAAAVAEDLEVLR